MQDSLLIHLIWILAGFVNGVTSFGGNLVATPLLTLFKEPEDTVVLACLSGLCITLLMTFFYRHHPPWKDLLTLVGASCIGAPAGLLFFGQIPTDFFLLLLAAILVFFLGWQLLPEKYKRARTRLPLWTGLPVGCAFGFLLILTSMPGPVVVIWGLLRRWNRQELMFMMNAVGSLGAVIAAVNYWGAGYLGLAELKNALGTFPFCAAGVFLSIPVVRRMSTETFRKGVLLMLAFFALVLLVRAFR